MIRRATRCLLLAIGASAAVPGFGQVITTVAGTIHTIPTSPLPALSATLSPAIGGVATDSNGNVYVADPDYNVVMRIGTDGTLSVVAGNGISGFSGDTGPATSASLSLGSVYVNTLAYAGGVAIDSAGNLYIADTLNSRIRKVSGGTITTVAGNGNGTFSGDGGPATSASLNWPTGVAVDSAGNLYIADDANHRIRKVSGGTITTVAGSGSTGGTGGFSGDGGPATSAELGSPYAVAVDSAGNIYIADATNNRIRKVSGGTITTIAGGGAALGDGGPATSAQLSSPTDVVVDLSGNLYIADGGNNRIRKVTAGTITTVAGNGTGAFSGDGGPAAGASLSNPTGIALDGQGNIYVADSANERIRKVTGGTITTFAGNGEYQFSGDGGPATSAELNLPVITPAGIAIDSAGELYIADGNNYRIRKVSNGIITTVAGGGTASPGDGGLATAAALSRVPLFVTVDSVGNVYFTDGELIYKVSGGVITTIVAGGSAIPPQLTPYGIAVDPAGDIYVADAINNRVLKISDGNVTTVAGNGSYGFSGDGGPATAASFRSPQGIVLDPAGNLYVVDVYNYRIRKISGGMITTIAGTGQFTFSGDGGPATSAGLATPVAIAIDAGGNLYFTEIGSLRVREISNGIINTIAGGGTSLADGVP
jgi:trimeric autotransporter adhesin